MNDEPEETNADATLEHSGQEFQPDDTVANDAEFTQGTTEMPESEIEPPTVSDQAESTSEDAMPEEPSETLEEPRDEVDLMDDTQVTMASEDTASVSDTSATETTGADGGRTPFHANEIHESTQSSAKGDDDTTPTSDESDTFGPASSTPIVSTDTEAAAMFAEPETEAMPSQADMTLSSPEPNVDTPNTKKRGWWSKKRTILVIVLVVIIALLAGGSVFAYKSWYQAPEKVLSDAVINFISAKSMTYSGSLTDSGDDTGSIVDNLKISFNGGVDGDTMNAHIDMTMGTGDKSIEIPVDVVSQKDAAYFKLSNLQKLEEQLVTPLLTVYGATSAEQKPLDDLVKSIDGTWYKVTPSDLNETSKDKQTDSCISDVISKIRTDHSTQNELMDVYKDHPLFTLTKELGSKNGSLGYQLTPVSNKKASEFVKALKDTPTYKSLIKCDSSLKSMFSSDDSLQLDDTTTDTGSMQVWVSRWSHQITKVTATSSGDGTAKLVFIPKVGDETPITIPSNAKSIDDLKAQFKKFEQPMLQKEAQAEAQAKAQEAMLKQEEQNAAQGLDTTGTTSNVEAIVQ